MTLLIAALLLLQFPQFVSGSIAIYLFTGLFGLSVLAWLRPRIIYGPLALLVALMVISASWSEHPLSALTASFSAFIVIASGLAVGAALPLPRILKVLHWTTLGIGAASLALGVALPSIGLHSGPAYTGTLIGLYVHKNALAAVMMFGILAMLFRERNGKNGLWPTLGSLAIYLPVLAWTESATTLAILAIGVLIRVVYGWWRQASHETRSAASGLILAPIVLLVTFAWSIYTGALGLLGRDTTLTGRTGIWEAALDAWRTHPWLGVGWGSFESDSTVAWFQFARYGWVRAHAHSGYIQVLTELGVVGAALLAFSLFAILIAVVRAVRGAPTLGNGWLIAALVAFVAHNVAEQSMRLLPLFILALVYAASVRQRQNQAPETTKAPHPRRGGALRVSR